MPCFGLSTIRILKGFLIVNFSLRSYFYHDGELCIPLNLGKIKGYVGLTPQVGGIPNFLIKLTCSRLVYNFLLRFALI